MISMIGINKSFGPNRVLTDVNFDLFGGEVHALLGENGAGKSTLMKILMGIYSCDSGEISFAGHNITAGTVRQHLASGIAMIFQELSLLPNLTVAQNIFSGREPLRLGWRVDYRKIRVEAQAIIDRFGFNLRADELVRKLGFAQCQMIEILKCVSRGAKVLIMDEPTSSLSTREEEKLFSIIEDLQAHGIGIIYISHRLSEIFRVAHRISIVKDGRIIGPMLPAEVDHAKIAAIMSKTSDPALPISLGLASQREVRSGEPVLVVNHLATAKKLQDIHVEIKAGEIVGIAGLVGSGRSTLAKALFGLLPDARGEIRVAGKTAKIQSPRDAIALGLGFVPEDRRIEGLILDHSLQENLTLPSLNRLLIEGPFSIVSRQKSQNLFDRFRQQLNIVSRRSSQKARELSGGNQQKIVFAKWLATKPKVLILDEPTAGVDINTKGEMRQMIHQIAQEGVGVLLISSELDEVVATADRILLMVEGQLTESEKTITTEAQLRSSLQNQLKQLRQKIPA